MRQRRYKRIVAIEELEEWRVALILGDLLVARGNDCEHPSLRWLPTKRVSMIAR
jgi:hypothetical protein